MFWRTDPLTKHIRKVQKLRVAQRQLMGERKALKRRALEVQRQLDEALRELADLQKDAARESGVKIGAVGVPSAERFGKV